jgi:urea carboxylase
MSGIRYSFGADEHVFAEIDEGMSLEAFFKGMAICKELEKRRIPGVSEICPSNASYLVRFDPDVIHPDEMMGTLKEIEAQIGEAEIDLPTRIVELPVFYNDPWTNETGQRFRERHQDPTSTDIEYSARINGYKSIDEFIAAHSGAPWFVSMVGFVAGLPWLYQIVERSKQIEAPKYLRPRTDTPLCGDLFRARRRRLSDVRDHAGTDLRSGAEAAVLQGFSRRVPARRHREVQVDLARGI